MVLDCSNETQRQTDETNKRSIEWNQGIEDVCLGIVLSSKLLYRCFKIIIQNFENQTLARKLSTLALTLHQQELL